MNEGDFIRAGSELSPSYHTKRALSCDRSWRSVTAGAPFSLARPNTLGCLAWLNTCSTSSGEVTRAAEHDSARTDARKVRIVDSTDELACGIPGIANEFWPLNNPLAGGENYGWGATLPTHIIRTIMGLREYEDDRRSGFTVAAALTARFRVGGTRLGMSGFRFLDRSFEVLYTSCAGER